MKQEIDIHFVARINKAVIRYYSQASPFKTIKNYEIWLRSLSPTLREHFTNHGFEGSRNSFPFMRFILELNDFGMDEFLQENLSSEDFKSWQNPDINAVVPDEMNLSKRGQ